MGVRFEMSSQEAQRNRGLSVVSFTGTYFALSSVYEQMRLFQELHQFKGGYHFTRLDAQVTTLNPSQSSEQIVADVENGVLWVKGYKGWKPEGMRNLQGQPVNGLSAVFGSPTSDRRAYSYNKAAEQDWDTAARRDEVRLRGDWAERHVADIAASVAGAACENAAITAYQSKTSATIAQHMQYLDITGTPKEKPKDWARGKKAPSWWTETLETKHEPLTKTRKEKSDVWDRFGHMKKQYGPTFVEACGELVKSGRSKGLHQAAVDLSMGLLQGAKDEHVERICERLPADMRQAFREDLHQAADAAAAHSEYF
jgi:hypothetical protein